MMPEIKTEVKTYVVEELFGSLSKMIYKEIMDTRKCEGDDQFSYQPLERTHGGKTYVITARHIQIGETMSYAKSSCNHCYGSGKKIMNMGKSSISNTDDYMMLASVSLKGLTEEQQQIVLEREKKSKFWKVLLPCPCTIKSMVKKNMQVLSNGLNNIVVELTCTEKVVDRGHDTQKN
jgi:DnaJ-class molecular chaperone